MASNPSNFPNTFQIVEAEGSCNHTTPFDHKNESYNQPSGSGSLLQLEGVANGILKSDQTHQSSIGQRDQAQESCQR